MEPTRYDTLFHEVERWVRKSRRLFLVAKSLTPQTSAALQSFIADAEGAKTQSPEFLEKAEAVSAFSSARALLFGLAIENAAKARQIQDGTVSSTDGVPKGLRTDHNLLEHVRQLGIKLDNKDESFLELLTYQTQSLAKYPIGKNVSSQNRFTGRTVGAQAIDADRAARVIREVLSDTELIKIFDHGYHMPK